MGDDDGGDDGASQSEGGEGSRIVGRSRAAPPPIVVAARRESAIGRSKSPVSRDDGDDRGVLARKQLRRAAKEESNIILYS